MQLFVFILAALLAGNSVLTAQNGDKEGEEQGLRISPDRIPPSPPLSPEQALQTFRLPEGFRIELVAAEPLVDSPVAMAFDPEGRLYVVEMRGYMRTYDGVGEGEPTGRIVLLEDTNGDGRMDKRTIFMDKLVLPRAIALVRDGVLVSEPPVLWFVRDTNGDGVADAKEVVARDYAVENDPKRGLRSNPEHTSNGLYRALDNWIYSANHTVRFRNVAGDWQREPTLNRGQWGITQDDFGRLYFNSNSDYLRGDLIPSHYANRSPIVPTPPGLNVQIDKDQTTWPGRMNPGVNRGYQPKQLRDDGTLATFTGACGPVIYRGSNFPKEYQGDAFVCEPTGNFIRRSKRVEKDGWVTATNAHAQTEFLVSTDERFRPVNLYNGPGGALYVVDLSRGLIQHRIYLTSYLRKQLESRDLLGPTDRGRIYRIVHEKGPAAKAPKLSKATSVDLVSKLSDPNGWERDVAQRLLVERNAAEAIGLLKKAAFEAGDARTRLHALWTLEGCDQIEPEFLATVLNDANPELRRAALRMSERFLRGGQFPRLSTAVLLASSDSSVSVRWQAALTLSELRSSEAVLRLLELADSGGPDYVRKAALASLSGKELEAIRIAMGDGWWPKATSGGRSLVLKSLAQSLFVERKSGPIHDLLETISKATAGEERQLTLLDGVVELASKPGRKPRPARLDAEPSAYQELLKLGSTQAAERLAKIDSLLVWPGKPGVSENDVPPPLTGGQQMLFEAGRELFVTTCAVCHQPHGRGQDGLAPPLLDSEWVLGPVSRLVRIVLQGATGPIKVGDRSYELDMPGLDSLDDESVASVLTYLRREWGHDAYPVSPSSVARVRELTKGRQNGWTAEELLRLP